MAANGDNEVNNVKWQYVVTAERRTAKSYPVRCDGFSQSRLHGPINCI